jgi:CRP/FNR family transcriptional regulator
MVGFYSVITGQVQALRALAVEDTRAGRMSGGDFMEMVLSRRALSEYMLRRVTSTLWSEINRIRNLILLEASCRVAADLLERAAEAGHVFEIPERIELSSRLGMTRETLARHLSDFQKRGLISMDKRKVHILDKQQLTEMVE